MEVTKLGNGAFTNAVVERTELGRADASATFSSPL
jgi:hypothetical protein